MPAENEPVRTVEAELMFSPELQEKMNKNIAIIRQTLSGQPELADRLLGGYNRFVQNEKQRAEKAYQIYEDIFFEKRIDEQEALEIILSRSIDILKEISIKLQGAGENEKYSEKEKAVEEIIGDLLEKQKITARAVEEIKKIAAEVNQMCAEIDQTRVDFYNKEEEIYRTRLEDRGRQLREAKEKIDRKEFRSNWEQQGQVFEDDNDLEDLIAELYDGSEYFLDDEFYGGNLKEYEEQENQPKEKLKKYDSYKIQNDIKHFENLYDEDGSQYKFAVEYLDPQIAENIKRNNEEEKKFLSL